MQSLSSNLIHEICFLRSQGIAFKKIAKQLNTSSANVFKYSKNIVLSETQTQNLFENEINNNARFIHKFAVEKEIIFSC